MHIDFVCKDPLSVFKILVDIGFTIEPLCWRERTQDKNMDAEYSASTHQYA